jgi:hypothetical protein
MMYAVVYLVHKYTVTFCSTYWGTDNVVPIHFALLHFYRYTLFIYVLYHYVGPICFVPIHFVQICFVLVCFVLTHICSQTNYPGTCSPIWLVLTGLSQSIWSKYLFSDKFCNVDNRMSISLSPEIPNAYDWRSVSWVPGLTSLREALTSRSFQVTVDPRGSHLPHHSSPRVARIASLYSTSQSNYSKATSQICLVVRK